MALDGNVAELMNHTASIIEKQHRMVNGQKFQVLTLDYLDRILKTVDDCIGKCCDAETAKRVRDAIDTAFENIPGPRPAA
jgi:hypothetical protein